MRLQVANPHYFRLGCLDRARRDASLLSTGDLCIYTLYIYTAERTTAWLLLSVGGRVAKAAIWCRFLSRQHVTWLGAWDTQVRLVRLGPSRLTQRRSTQGCLLIIHFSKVPVYNYEARFRKCSFVAKHAHKVTRLSRRSDSNCGKQTASEPISNFLFLSGPSCAQRNDSSWPINKIIINILNYLHKENDRHCDSGVDKVRKIQLFKSYSDQIPRTVPRLSDYPCFFSAV